MSMPILFFSHAFRLVLLEFEHSTFQRPSMVLKEGDFIGDMALVGEMNWAKSTCFNFPPKEVDEDREFTELRVTPYQESYVVCLTLSTEKFQEVLANGSQVTVVAVQEFHDKWKRTRAKLSEDADEGNYAMEQIYAWEHVVAKLKDQLKKQNREDAVQQNDSWKIARVQKQAKNGGASAVEQEVLKTTLAGDHKLSSVQEDIKAIKDKLAGIETTHAKILDMLTKSNIIAKATDGV